jgi:hypothetical protein
MAIDPLQDMPETPELRDNRFRPLTERSKIHPKIRAHPDSQNRVAAARERVCVGAVLWWWARTPRAVIAIRACPG